MNMDDTIGAWKAAWRWTARLLAAMLCGAVISASAQEAALDQPVLPPSEDHPLSELYSGYRYQPAYIKRLQDQDIRNPGTLWRDYGAKLWSQADGEAGKSCASCHNVAEKAMRGVGARYPKFDAAEGRPLSLEQRINQCRRLHMKAQPWPEGAEPLLAMTTYVRAHSRGMPLRVKIDGQAAAAFEAGKAYFYRARGDLDMSCASCHEANAGEKLGVQTISQGQSNGFPAYQIGLERVVPLHGQFQRCNARVGAEPLPLGSAPYVNLELYLAWRGAGLPIETPAVRN